MQLRALFRDCLVSKSLQFCSKTTDEFRLQMYRNGLSEENEDNLLEWGRHPGSRSVKAFCLMKCNKVFSASLFVTALLLLTVFQIAPEILKHTKHVETKQLKERRIIS